MTRKSEQACWVGFDLGGTKMLAAVFDGRFRLIGTAKVKTKGQDGLRAVLSRVSATIRAALAEARVPAGRVAGIGVGFPGPVDPERGIILAAPNLGWRNVPLRRVLERRFRCRAIVANDVDAGTYAEYRFGAARGARSVLGVFPGTCIGGAFLYEGRLIRGRRVTCMEFGHVTVEPGGRRCGCGRRGCLEAVASRLAISAEAAAAVYRGEAPGLAREAGTDLADIKSGTLAKAIRAGDRVVERIVRDAAGRLGDAIGGAINLLAPDVVVLGGGLVEALPRLFLHEVRRAAERNAMAPFAGSFRVATARLGDLATALGAAALAADAADAGGRTAR